MGDVVPDPFEGQTLVLQAQVGDGIGTEYPLRDVQVPEGTQTVADRHHDDVAPIGEHCTVVPRR
jgi:hypothetical protein